MLEKRHTRLSTNLTNLRTISSSHPFTQQVDVIFPSGYVGLENALSILNTRYARGKLDLARVFSAATSFVHLYTPSTHEHDRSSPSQIQPAGDVLALSVNRVENPHNDDVWCIDTRGVLTLCVCKETYERLGLVGQKLSFKHQSGERYVIPLSLHENAESVPVQTRRRRALESWDTGLATNVTSAGKVAKSQVEGPSSGRQMAMDGVWDVIYCSTTPADVNVTDGLDRWTSQVPVLNPDVQNIVCEKVLLENIWVPSATSISRRPHPKQQEEYEEWEQDISALFEWVGMAGLHAQRLQANDRVDPYVAVYEPPSGSRIENLTHLRWRGLLSPAFVQTIIDASMTFLQTGQQSPPESLVAITVHGFTNSPVVYLPPPSRGAGKNPKGESKGLGAAVSRSPAAHLPSKDGEDTWCLILSAMEEDGRQNVKNALFECVGQWDARWG